MLKLSLNLISVIFFPPLLVFQGKKTKKRFSFIFFHTFDAVCLTRGQTNLTYRESNQWVTPM